MHNDIIEQIVIGSLINNNDMFELVSDVLDWKFFLNPNHQIFFREIQTRLNNGSIANVITLSNSSFKNDIDSEYLTTLTKHATSSENIREYALIIRELYIKREAIILSDLLKEKAQEDNFLSEGIYKIEEKLYNLSTTNTQKHTTISFNDGVKNVTENIKNMLESQRKIIGLTTGFIDLDNLIGGLHNGYLYIVAARPSMGKTALAGNIGMNCAIADHIGDGGPVAFISLEMPYSQIVMRLMSSLTNVPLSNLINCRMSKRDLSQCLESLSKFSKLPFFIHDTSTMSIGEIRTTLRQMKRKWGIKLAIIDYLQLIHGGTNNNENRTSEVSRITRNLKSLAKELNIPIIVLSQLSRSTEKEEDHRPQLWHLRESGSIEQDADVVIFILRQAYYKSKEDTGNNKLENIIQQPDNGVGVARIFVDKNRNGATGHIDLMYNSITTSFKNFFR